ncbi:MAG: ABC transporter ATP-binding protein [Holosporales bacterium]|jgi:lipoprotein-releasing system ATP-binding protein|nr:ABC transporter ATP-binding protein [Holosporales bacterium]
MLPVLELLHVYKSFAGVDVLVDINLQIKKGESIALVGESGSGKTTLLQVAALLEKHDKGSVLINNTLTNNMNESNKTLIRKKNIGFIYQFHNLLPEFTSLENVMIPLMINGESKGRAREKAEDLIISVGLEHRKDQYPKKLSGGEQQRVAIARALALSPNIIIADEPTGNLDNTTSSKVFNLFVEMINKNGMSLLMATHNLEFADKLAKKILIKNGSLTVC